MVNEIHTHKTDNANSIIFKLFSSVLHQSVVLCNRLSKIFLTLIHQSIITHLGKQKRNYIFQYSHTRLAQILHARDSTTLYGYKFIKPTSDYYWKSMQLYWIVSIFSFQLSQRQVIKFTSCLPMVGGALQVFLFLPPLKLVAMI